MVNFLYANLTGSNITTLTWSEELKKKKKIEFSIKKKTNTLLTDKKNIGDSRAKLLYV